MKLLAITSRASDFVELSELAVELDRRGHHVRLLHVYPESARVYHESTFAAVVALHEEHPGIEAECVQVETISKPRRAKSREGKDAAVAKRGPPRALRQRMLYAIGMFLARHSPRNHRYFQRLPHRGQELVSRVAAGFVALLRMILYPGVTARIVAPPAVKQLLMALPMLRFYRRFLVFFTAEIRAHGIEALLLPEDVVGYTWPVAIKAGHNLGIPSLVFPYTLANRQEPLRSLRDEPLFQTRNSPAVPRLFPKWRWKDADVDLIRMPFEHIYAHEFLRVAPPDPWTMNSGYSNRICVDSPAAYDFFKEAGIPESKMEVTGSASQDRMHALKVRKAEALAQLRRELALDGEKPLLLVSGCPEQLTGPVPACEFRTMSEIAAFVGQCLQPLGERYHLVVRPHPNYSQFGAMLEPFGFANTQRPTASLVPVADLFIAFASSTIRWAISSGVPTVNYDVFHYGYGEYAEAGGVLSLQKKDDFRVETARLLPASAAYRELAARIAADSARWSMMDGHCVDRIEAAIQRECATHPAPRTSR